MFQTYKIRDHFRDALKLCLDVDADSFPHLSMNTKSSKHGNISKITKQAYRRLMIAIVRLYVAHVLFQELNGEDESKRRFSFSTYPSLRPMFEVLENHLANVHATKNETASMKKQSKESLNRLYNTELNRVEKLIISSVKTMKDAAEGLGKARLFQQEMEKREKRSTVPAASTEPPIGDQLAKILKLVEKQAND